MLGLLRPLLLPLLLLQRLPTLQPFHFHIHSGSRERTRWFWAGGRTEEANEAGCPFVLAGCGVSDHPSLSEASISGTPLSLPSPPLTPEALPHRHARAKWSLNTILTEFLHWPCWLDLEAAHQFFLPRLPSWSLEGAGEWRVKKTKNSQACDGNKIGLFLVV